MSKNASAPKGGISNPATDLNPEHKAKLDALEQEHDVHMITDQFDSMYKMATYHEKRREKLKAIPNFWPTVIQNDAVMLSVYGNHAEDLEAIRYLEDVWIAREKPDPRAYTIEMHFKENPFFSNKVLKKEYRLKQPHSGKVVDGIHESMITFNPDKDLVLSKMKIDWKSEKMNLSKKYPAPSRSGADDMELEDMGSFFNLFESTDDELSIGDRLANELFVSPISYFKGEIPGDNDDEDEDEELSSEDDDSDQDEIDLERPRKRVKRV